MAEGEARVKVRQSELVRKGKKQKNRRVCRNAGAFLKKGNREKNKKTNKSIEPGRNLKFSRNKTGKSSRFNCEKQ